jgi:hypothetical protein
VFKEKIEMKAMLLRVGVDKGTDGALGPIFEDGTFEYIPMSENFQSKEQRTYASTIGSHGRPLSTYLPGKIDNRVIHFDPEFETFTYGDPTVKRKYLLKLQKEDLLVFYAGLTPFRNDKYKEALYLIGYFTVENVVDFNQLSEYEMGKYYLLYSNNAHLKRMDYPEDLVIIAGSRVNSRLLDNAILISQTKYDKKGKAYNAVSKEMEVSLGISGSIQRSIPPRFITSRDKLENLKHILRL